MMVASISFFRLAANAIRTLKHTVCPHCFYYSKRWPVYPIRCWTRAPLNPSQLLSRRGCDERGRTILHIACIKDGLDFPRLAIIHLILQTGADIRMQAMEQATDLFIWWPDWIKRWESQLFYCARVWSTSRSSKQPEKDGYWCLDWPRRNGGRSGGGRWSSWLESAARLVPHSPEINLSKLSSYSLLSSPKREKIATLPPSFCWATLVN